jgi:hypothetical protein
MAGNVKEKALADAKRAQSDYKREIAAARNMRRKSFEKAQKAGSSLRDIGKAVGLHPTRVREILRGE